MAKRLALKAKLDLGIEGKIPLTLTILDEPNSIKMAEYLHAALSRIDIDLTIDIQNAQMLLQKYFEGSTDLTMVGLIAALGDPVDTIAAFGNPKAQSLPGFYKGRDMLKLYRDYERATNRNDRIGIAIQVDQLIQNKALQVTLLEDAITQLIDPRLKGYVYHSVRGFSDFRAAYIVDKLPEGTGPSARSNKALEF